MLKEFSKAASALGTLCVILQNNQDGARSLIALAVISYVLYWASPH